MKKYIPAEWEATRRISAKEQAAIHDGLATEHQKRLGVASGQN